MNNNQAQCEMVGRKQNMSGMATALLGLAVSWVRDTNKQ